MARARKRDFKVSWVDNLVGVFSPRAKAKRLKYKAFSTVIKRKYEGADTGRRTDGWITYGNSANSEIEGALSRLRDRSRDLVRNNPYAKRGVHGIANNTVGRGIMTQLKLDDDRKISDAERTLNGVWGAWSKTTACDYEGRMTLVAMQRLIMKSIAESGESLVRYRREGVRTVEYEGLLYRVPAFSLQILESDFLQVNHQPKVLKNGNTVKMGIELDERGKRIAYHLYQDHPGDIGLMRGTRLSTITIPENELRHLYEVDRAGQLRGTPWLAAVMLRLKDFDLFEDATLKRQQCAAMFTAFVKDVEGYDDLEEEDEEEELGEKMEPGLIEMLPPGKDVTLSKPPGADGYDAYTRTVLQSIATGLGVSYASLTGNLNDVNFSSGRMGHLEMQRNIDTWRDEIMIAQFMAPLWLKFKEEMTLIGDPIQKARAVFAAPRREMIDPVKEGEALKTAVRSGFKTISQVIREDGGDPATHLQEIADDNKTLDELGLTLDSDGRTGQNGEIAQAEPDDDDDPSGDGGGDVPDDPDEE